MFRTASRRGHYTKQGAEKGGRSLGLVPSIQEVANRFMCSHSLGAPAGVAEPKAKARESGPGCFKMSAACWGAGTGSDFLHVLLASCMLLVWEVVKQPQYKSGGGSGEKGVWGMQGVSLVGRRSHTSPTS